MERKIDLNDNAAAAIIYIIFGVGITGHILAVTYPIMLTMTPYVLLLLGLFLIYRIADDGKEKLLYWMTGVFLFTSLMEIIGVKTGYIFGEYEYGNILALKVFEVPLIIGFNWTFVILGAISLSQRITQSKLLIVFLTGIMAVIFDIILEPAAIELGYWRWIENSIPLLNYVSWFLIAVTAAAAFVSLAAVKLSLLPGKYFMVQFVFFLLIIVT